MPSQDKVDLYKMHKEQYAAPKQARILETGSARYLAVDGRGAPGSEEFSEKVGALYGAAYTIKMTRKFSGGQDYVICKLEGLYWLDDGSCDFAGTPSDQWNWKLMIRTPNFVEEDELSGAVEKLLKKGKQPEVRSVKLETLSEGACVQMLHVGPYELEHETISKMEEFAREQGLEFHGRHHEIYLSDPRRVPPEKLKTILRHPVRKK